MMRRPTRSPRSARTAGGALLATLALGLSACGIGGGVGGSLPGGADVGSDPVRITAEFTDVLDLVPQSNVKVDNVTVGRVTKVTLGKDGRTARVQMVVRRDADLVDGTTARLQQTSLLGEKYVALVPPSTERGASAVALKSGTVLDNADTDAAATAEQVLGSLSLVLNGGGIGQFQEISRELQKAGADGRTAQARKFLEELNRFVTVLDGRRSAITGAIDGLAALGKNLEADTGKIADVLDGIEPGLAVLRDQRPQLTEMLKALDRLSTVTVSTLNASQADIVADLKALDPILTQLAKAGDALPKSLEVLLTYPFPDSVLGAIKGDYINAFIVTAFSTPGQCRPGDCVWAAVGSTSGASPSGRAAAGSGGATSGGSSKSGASTAPPTFLPPTDNALPGLPSPTTAGPSILPGTSGPTGASSSSPTSSPSAGGSDTAGPTGSPSGSSSPSGSGSATPSGGQ